MQTPQENPVLAKRKRTARSRVTNGNDLLPGIDGRSPTARRYRDIVAAVASDMGGADRLSEASLQLVRRFAAAACLAEAMEARLVSGEPINIAEHSLLASTLVRIAQRIGINRVPKNITPALSDYLENNLNEAPDYITQGVS
jgi:hypothetical protein